jgi:hypothetical protein
MEEFCILAVDAGQEKLRLGLGASHGWPLAQNGGIRTATLDISAGSDLSAVSMLHWGSPMWELRLSV